ncbi:putative phosphodiesterase I [Helianthus anomalus]
MAKLDPNYGGSKTYILKSLHKTGGVENVYTQKFYTKTTYITLLSEKFGGSGAPGPFYTSPLGMGEDTEWINVNLEYPRPTNDDWVGVFSPAKFNSSDCYPETGTRQEASYICTSPIKYKYANHSTADYVRRGKATLSFQIINQREDFSFALFTGGFKNPKLVAVSDPISFSNPKAPLYPRLAHGKAWDEYWYLYMVLCDVYIFVRCKFVGYVIVITSFGCNHVLWTNTIARYGTCPTSVVWSTDVGFIYQMGYLTHQTSLLGCILLFGM